MIKGVCSNLMVVCRIIVVLRAVICGTFVFWHIGHSACVFDRSGISANAQGDGSIAQEADLASHEGGLDRDLGRADVPVQPADVDGTPSLDGQGWPDLTPSPDLTPPDIKPLPDNKPPPGPVTPQQVIAAFASLKASCLTSSGNPAGPDIPIIDSNLIGFFPGTTTLAGAPAATKTWVGSSSSVTVLFDPNSCGQEDPINNDGAWGSAGLLIRGASLDGQGRLVLEPWVTAQDMDFLDVTGSGGFESSSDFAKPNDSDLPLYPQLVPPVNAAKQAIIQLANP